MRNIILLIAILMATHSLFAQQEPGKLDYLKKSKQQKTIGKILLGTGGALMMAGVLVFTDDVGGVFDPGDKQNSSLADVLGYTGAAITLASIPFFIAAGKNKKKALAISFKNVQTPQLQKNSFIYKPAPSINIKFPL